ncbi:gliding motility-associated C-terminal domain-containing protein [Spirochaeta thermophila]|uniref:OmpA family protein n=1 Tax=Winmispira thermophila (strain ATCC 49972 / DSM 6192 / RI 19.B1) TaxID=665571 RepID=E0RNK8_WINT6|nr:gliding motility-associated C-terminal domain-containing protein [Spirochaeta thermophila]ADN02599.1 OmpA family protein [Spirochaeta thermophila DSM 6192]
MKRCWTVVAMLVLLPALLFAGGKKEEGPPVVSLGEEDAVYISPGASPGVQDSIVIPLSVTANTSIQDYRIVIQDEGGKVVFTAQSEPLPKPGFFSNLLISLGLKKRPSVEIPSSVEWSGTDAEGRAVPEGSYTCSLTVTDHLGQTSTSSISVVVDNTPPSAQVRIPEPIFSPNGDGSKDTIVVEQSGSTEEQWIMSVQREDGTEVFRYVLENGAPASIFWNGKLSDGTIIPDGEYYYVLSSTDRAGNAFSTKAGPVVVDAAPKQVVVKAEPDHISPNADDVQDFCVITLVDRSPGQIVGVRGEVRDADGRVLASVSSFELPTTYVFNGRFDDTVLPDGEYTLRLETEYLSGTVAVTEVPVVIDTQPPVALLQYGPRKLSPNDDGFQDVFVVEQTSPDKDVVWTSEVRSPQGQLVLTRTWEGGLGDFVWDGTDETGKKVPEGLYTYRVYARDEAGNLGMAEVNEIAVSYALPQIGLAVDHPGFSPNGDGVRDSLEITVTGDEGLPVNRLVITITTPQGERYVVDQEMLGVEGIVIPFTISTERLLTMEVPDGRYEIVASVTYGEKGTVLESPPLSVWVDTVPPEVSVSAEPVPFSPDGDGRDEVVAFIPEVRDEAGIESWELMITNKDRRQTFSGGGEPPAQIVWDGFFESGDLAEQAHEYPVVFTVTDLGGNVAKASALVVTDVYVVIKDGGAYISVPDIHFAPFTADYTDKVPPEIREENLRTLDEVAAMLKKFPQYTVQLEGHAVSLLWFDPERAKIEHQEVLIPLSRARAEAVRKALISRGVDPSRLSIVGYGGSRPIVPFSDLKKRWVNRRVEFLLKEKSGN